MIKPSRPLSKAEHSDVLALAKHHRQPRLALRASIALLSRDSALTQANIARKLNTSRRTVRVWTQKFAAGGSAALKLEQTGRGRRSRQPQRRQQVVEAVANWVAREVKMSGYFLNKEVPRLSQRKLARHLKIPTATLNRLLLREGWRLIHGYIKRQRFKKDSVLAGVFLDPPLRVVALRSLSKTAARNSSGATKADQPLRKHTGELLRFLKGLENRLATVAKTAGRTEGLSRFLRSLANVESWTGEITIYCCHARLSEHRLLRKYPQMPCYHHRAGPYENWLADALSQNGLRSGLSAGLGTAFAKFQRLLSRRIQKSEQRPQGLRRPFQFLSRREPAGPNRYWGDLLKPSESRMDLLVGRLIELQPDSSPPPAAAGQAQAESKLPDEAEAAF